MGSCLKEDISGLSKPPKIVLGVGKTSEIKEQS
jgi:hypothetical protein